MADVAARTELMRTNQCSTGSAVGCVASQVPSQEFPKFKWLQEGRRTGRAQRQEPQEPRAPKHEPQHMITLSVENDIHISDILYFYSPTVSDRDCFATGPRGPRIIHPSPVVSYTPRMYNARPPPPGRETITIGDRRRIKVEDIGNMDVIFHGKSDDMLRLVLGGLWLLPLGSTRATTFL